MKKYILLIVFGIISLNSCKNESKSLNTNNLDIKNNTTQTEKKVAEKLSLKEKISFIKTNFKKIESNLLLYQNKSLTVESEFGLIESKSYFENNTIVKIKSQSSQGHSSEDISYYLNDNKLFFVHQIIYGELSVNGPYINEEKRIYISNNEVLKCLKKYKTTTDIDDFDMTEIPNIDITEEMKNNPSKINKLISTYSKLKKEFENLISHD